MPLVAACASGDLHVPIVLHVPMPVAWAIPLHVRTCMPFFRKLYIPPIRTPAEYIAVIT